MSGEATAIIVLVFLAAIAFLVWKATFFVREKEVIIIERLGQFSKVCNAGLHFIIPYIEYPKRYTWRYTAVKANRLCNIQKIDEFKIMTQTEVIDFPGQSVISRDNASIKLDCVLQFKIQNPKLMIYSTINLPYMLSRLLQAYVRNVAGTLDVDQLVDDTSEMSLISGKMEEITVQWGVRIEKVQVQKVITGALEAPLAKRKQAELNNKKIVTDARAQKQTTTIEGDGEKDKKVKHAQGKAQEKMSIARGHARATVIEMKGECERIRQIAAALGKENLQGDDMMKYLLSLKYIDALETVTRSGNISCYYCPTESLGLTSLQTLGINTIMPTKVM